jgi:hypothetical protein
MDFWSTYWCIQAIKMGQALLARKVELSNKILYREHLYRLI